LTSVCFEKLSPVFLDHRSRRCCAVFTRATCVHRRRLKACR